MRRLVAVFLGAALAAGVRSAVAQPAKGSAAAQPAKTSEAVSPAEVDAAAAQPATGQKTVLVPPQGGTARIPVPPSGNVLLSFEEALVPRAVTSTADWEIRDFGDGVVARAKSPKAADTTLALATKSGKIKVNVTLTVAKTPQEALTLVAFQASTAEAAFRAAVEAEVERQTATLRAEVAEIKRAIAEKVRDRADNMIARRLLARDEQFRLSAHERNDDNVIVHVDKVRLLGEDAWLIFDIENRSGSAYRLAKVQVLAPGGKDHAGPASVLSNVVDDDSALIGVVGAGTKARVAVVLRGVDELLAKTLALSISEPDGRGRITVRRGIVLR